MVGASSGKATPRPEEGYTVAQLANVLGTTPAKIRGFVRAGFLQPKRGTRGEYRFSFRDVVLLRSAQGLSDSLPTRKVRRALRTLQSRLPRGGALAAMQIRAKGDDVVVCEGGSTWHAESGQLLMDFDVAELAPKVAPLAHAGGKAARARSGSEGQVRSADEWFEIGVELETGAPPEAAHAYEQALSVDPGHADACINLGRMVHDAGDRVRAGELYRRALASRPRDVVALFNLGVVLDDGGELELALEAYRHALEVDPQCADAHYNAARICEQLGDAHGAFRHLRTYRALSRRP